MSNTLQQHLDRLHTQHPAIQRFAVAALFEALAQHEAYASKAGTAALRACLGHTDQVVAEEAVRQLRVFVPKPGLKLNDALDLILAALAAAGEGTVDVLIQGAAAMCVPQQLGRLPAGSEGTAAPAWSAHPFSKLLASHAGAQAPLLAVVSQRLGQATKLRPQERKAAWRWLQPFCAYVLLAPDKAGERAAFQKGLHALLVRAACTSPGLLPLLLPWLAAQLARAPLATPQQRLNMAEQAQDVIDVLDSCEDESIGSEAAAAVACSLVQLCYEMQAVGASFQALLRGLRRLGTWAPDVVAAHVANLAGLLPRASSLDAQGLLSLLASALKQAAREGGGVAELLVYPLIQILALQPDPAAPGSFNAYKVQARSATLLGCKPCTAASVAAVRAFPLLGISMLPVLLYRLQLSVASVASTKQGSQSKQAAATQQALLRALPDMGVHVAAVPFVLKALQPFADPGAPQLLQAVALRLYCRAWQASGRHFPRLQALLAACTGLTAQPAIPLRLARAACLRDVCAHDSSKGVLLVRAIQECMHDEEEGVAALGLECIGLLCEADALDFYAAWRVVHARCPRLPARPLVAREWVALLAHGGLDAAVYPDRAAAVIDLLWAATSSPVAQVREAAYGSLASYSLESLEALEALRPLADHSRLLLAEAHPAALPACQVLVGQALALEHTRRRRYVGMGGQSGGRAASSRAAPSSSDPASLTHRLARVLPRSLLPASGPARATASAGALLLLWAPPAPQRTPEQPPSTAQHSTAQAASDARQAANQYRQRFQEAAAQLPPSAAGQYSAALHAWRAFMLRWLQAERAAQRVDAAQAACSSAAYAAGKEIWAAIEACAQEGLPLAIENSWLAAGALSSILPEQAHQLAGEIVTYLRLQLRSHMTAASARGAAAGLGVALAGLHPTDWATKEDCATQLERSLLGSLDSSVRAACAGALGTACQHLQGDTGDRQPPRAAGWFRCLQSLLHVLRMLLPESAAALDAPIPAAGAKDLETGVMPPSLDAGEVLVGVLAGLAHLMPYIPTSDAPDLPPRFHALLLGLLQQPGTPASAPGGPSASALGSRDGEVAGAAALAGSCLVNSALQLGLSIGQDALSAHLAALETASEGAGKVAHSSALRSGIAGALATLLGADALLPQAQRAGRFLLASPDQAVQARQALQLLETLALKESEPRVRAAAAWALASACHSARASAKPGSAAGSASKAAGAAASRALAGYPEDGAMRPLVEALLAADAAGYASMQCLEAMHGTQQGSVALGRPLHIDPANVRCAGRAVYATSRLVSRGRLPHRELQRCRVYCIDMPASPMHAALPVAVAAAAEHMPHALQQQALMEMLDAVLVCRNPQQALNLVGLHVAVWADVEGSQFGERCITLDNAESTTSLPSTLPSLMSTSHWQPAAQLVVTRLVRICLTDELGQLKIRAPGPDRMEVSPDPGLIVHPIDAFASGEEKNGLVNWICSNTQCVFPTGPVKRGTGPASALPLGSTDGLSCVQVTDPDSGEGVPLGRALVQTDCVGFLVLRKGCIEHEWYGRWGDQGDALTPNTQRLWYSVTKTLSGCLAGILAAEGALDIDEQVTYYIPELNPAALDGVTVRDLLNMRSGIKYTEGFGPEWDAHMQSRGFLPKPTPEHPDCQYLWMRDCVTERAHKPGSQFEYKEVDTELLGWVLERASGGKRLYQLVSECIWSKLGCEDDAHMLIDKAGSAMAGCGMNATLRDTARYGQMLLNGGKAHDGTQVVPAAWLEEVYANSKNEVFKTQRPDDMMGIYLQGA
ncbi:hypothetical protein WJX72_007541 [[Myrmecia] bisecta]|uniref:Uncharacterized protein n=1 Tax=[Myrmecia] bisecta TaxID=41462 RepID=A0AAW1QSF6_9CHLO